MLFKRRQVSFEEKEFSVYSLKAEVSKARALDDISERIAIIQEINRSNGIFITSIECKEFDADSYRVTVKYSVRPR